MSLKAKVIEINSDLVIAEAEPQLECQKCGACAFWADKNTNKPQKCRISLQKPDFILKAGDIVEIEAITKDRAAISIIIFLLPILAFFLCAFFAQEVYFALSYQITELESALYGFLGVGIVFFFIRLYTKSKKYKPPRFVIAKKSPC